jgi:hypothetical protein
MKNYLLNFIKSLDTDLSLSSEGYEYVGGKKPEVYINFKKQNINKLLKRLSTNFDIKIEHIEMGYGYVCYKFYMGDDFLIKDEGKKQIYTVETIFRIVSRNKTNLYFEYLKNKINKLWK